MKTSVNNDTKYSNDLTRILADIDYFQSQIQELESLKKSNKDIAKLYLHRSEHCQHNITEIDLILLRLNQTVNSLKDRAFKLSELVFCIDELDLLAVSS